MNQRNVEALTNLYLEWMGLRPATMPLPQFFASRGVLVPSVLTSQDNWLLNRAAGLVAGQVVISREALIAELERIAKGEQI